MKNHEMNNARSQFGRVSQLWLNSSLKDEDVSNNLSDGTITDGTAYPIAGGRHRLPEANLAEAVRDGVGAVLMTVDERGDVLAEVSSLARLLGREHNVLELDLLHRRGGRAPKTFNPFSYAGADGIRAILESQLMAESLAPPCDDSGGAASPPAEAIFGPARRHVLPLVRGRRSRTGFGVVPPATRRTRPCSLNA
jgi:hypothetical protein